MRSVIPLGDPHDARRIVPLHDQRSVARVQALDWPGVLLEAGRNDVVEVDDLTLAHHYLGINTDRRPITLEVKEPTGLRRVTIAPETGWLSPAGQPFSLRVRAAGPHAYVRVSIDPQRFDRLVRESDDADARVELRRTFELGGPQLRHLVAAMVAEARTGTPGGLAFVDTLTAGLALQMLHHARAGTPRPAPARGGLAPAVKRRVLELMDAQADRHLTLDALAHEAGLSLAHFGRAFKESVGRAPHQHLMSLRLERARRLLEATGAALSEVAARAGFADQAHFTRLFKRQFGMTPGAFVRSRRR